MTIQDVYEQMRIEARTCSNTWDDLDYASGFCDDASDVGGEFLPWDQLSELLLITFTQRLQPWLARRGGGE